MLAVKEGANERFRSTINRGDPRTEYILSSHVDLSSTDIATLDDRSTNLHLLEVPPALRDIASSAQWDIDAASIVVLPSEAEGREQEGNIDRATNRSSDRTGNDPAINGAVEAQRSADRTAPGGRDDDGSRTRQAAGVCPTSCGEPGIATRYGTQYQGRRMGCGGTGTYDPADPTIAAVGPADYGRWPCGTRLRVCALIDSHQGPVESKQSLQSDSNVSAMRCLVVYRSDSCPGCGPNHIDLSEQGIGLLCGEDWRATGRTCDRINVTIERIE